MNKEIDVTNVIIEAKKEHAMSLAELAKNIWNSHDLPELKKEFETIIDCQDAKCFLKFDGTTPVGFAQCSLRHDYVEGTSSAPVGYLEGIFVSEQFRNQGIAKELLMACEKWSRDKGCKEFASDCEINNEDSFQFHRAMGFMEANRIICFAKRL